jgi:hypothetical protein
VASERAPGHRANARHLEITRAARQLAGPIGWSMAGR